MLRKLDEVILENIVSGAGQPDVVQVSPSAFSSLVNHNPNFQIVSAGGSPGGITILSINPSLNAAVTMEKMTQV
jgi:hypothetical protein